MPVAMPEWMQPASVPIVVDEADTEHVYTPRKPEIPPQWVPVSEYRRLVDRVTLLEKQLYDFIRRQEGD